MDTETNDGYDILDYWKNRVARTRRQARLQHCGTVRLVNGEATETYVNQWVPEGEERVIDIS